MALLGRLRALPLAVKLGLAFALAAVLPMAPLAAVYRVPLAATSSGLAGLAAAVGGAAVATAALAGVLVALRLARRLAALDKAARDAASGRIDDLDLDPGPEDEVGRLAGSWRESLAALAATRRELAAAADELKKYARELEERVEQRTRELAAKNEELTELALEATGLARAASEIGRAADTDEVVARLTAEAKGLVRVDFMLLFLLSSDGKELVPVAPHAADAARIGRARIAVDDPASASARALRERRTVLLDAASSATGDLLAAARASVRAPAQPGPREAFAIPIVARERALGVLLAGFEGARSTPSRRELQLVETIAAEAGIAIDRARLTASLAERERDLRDFIEKANDPIFAYGPDGRFTRANQAALSALGYTLDELREKRFPDLCDAEVPDAGTNESGERSVALTTVLVARDGRRLPLELRTRTVRREGAIVEIQVIGRDMGARAELEQGRVEAARLKTAIELAGATAHNLNQPLTGILGFTDILLADATKKEDRDMLEQIRKQALRMAETVKKMKTLTRLETEAYVGDDRIVKLG